MGYMETQMRRKRQHPTALSIDMVNEHTGRVLRPNAAARADEAATKVFLTNVLDYGFLSRSLDYLIRRARRWRRNGAAMQAEFADAFQTAALGIAVWADAHRGDDPEERGAIGPYVRAEMERYLQELQPSGFGDRVYRRLRQTRRFVREFELEQGREPSVDEIRSKLGLTTGQYDDVQLLGETWRWSSLDAPMGSVGKPDSNDEDQDTRRCDYIGSHAYEGWGWDALPAPDEAAQVEQERERLLELLAILKPNEREIVLSDDTDVALAQDRGITKQAVNKMRHQAIEKMRKAAARRGWITTSTTRRAR